MWSLGMGMTKPAGIQLSLWSVSSSCIHRCRKHCSWWPVQGAKSPRSCLVTPWTVAHQTPLSMGFSRQEYWSGVPFPSPGDLSDPGIKLRSPALQTEYLPYEPSGMPIPTSVSKYILLVLFLWRTVINIASSSCPCTWSLAVVWLI